MIVPATACLDYNKKTPTGKVGYPTYLFFENNGVLFLMNRESFHPSTICGFASKDWTPGTADRGCRLHCSIVRPTQVVTSLWRPVLPNGMYGTFQNRPCHFSVWWGGVGQCCGSGSAGTADRGCRLQCSIVRPTQVVTSLWHIYGIVRHRLCNLYSMFEDEGWIWFFSHKIMAPFLFHPTNLTNLGQKN